MDAETLYAKARHFRRLPPDTIYKSKGFLPYATAREYGLAMRHSGFTLGQCINFLLASDIVDKDVRELSIGYHGERVCLHFVGFRGEEYWSAVRIWGKPHYTHPQADFRMIGDMGPQDVVIFGPKAFNVPHKWRQQAH